MNQLKSYVFLTTLGLCVLALPAKASAQLSREVPLSRVVYELYLNEIAFLQELGLDPSRSDLDDPIALTQALGTQLSSFPLGSSAGGFTWTFDRSVGAFTRATQSFGPIFAERALTVGAKKLNFGINFQRATFDDFEGLDLDTGDVRFFNGVTSTLFSKSALDLRVSTNTVGFFVNYGVTDRFDLGFALPLVTVDLKASTTFSIVDSTGQNVSTFAPETTTAGRSKTGFGDIVARAKYNVYQQSGGGVAVGLDWRLPTGDEDNLLGVAGTQAKIYGVYSMTYGRFNPHLNVGYTFSTSNSAVADELSIFFDLPDEFNYTAGVDVTIHPKLTVAGDIVGRTLRDVFRLEVGDPFGLGPSFNEFVSSDSTTLRSVLGSAGVKYNVWGNLLLTGNVLFPLTDGGLRDKFTPLFGIDYSF